MFATAHIDRCYMTCIELSLSLSLSNHLLIHLLTTVELETQYKLDDERKSAPVREELDVDTLIGSRQRGGGDGGKIEKVSRDGQDRRQSGTSGKGGCGRPNVAATNKTLSYGSSSDDEE